MLIVDDDRATRLLARTMVELGVADVEAVDVASVDEALDLIAGTPDDPPVLVVMDYDMPGRNGVDGTRAVRAALDTKVVVVLFTATLTDDVRSAAFAAGAKACLDKSQAGLLPVVVEQLLVDCD